MVAARDDDCVNLSVAMVTGDPATRAAAERVRDEIAAMPEADTTRGGRRNLRSGVTATLLGHLHCRCRQGDERTAY